MFKQSKYCFNLFKKKEIVKNKTYSLTLFKEFLYIQFIFFLFLFVFKNAKTFSK